MRAFITGLAGPELTEKERAFLRDAQPWGFILFRRNVVEPESLRRLVDDVRTTLGWPAPVLIDQEGGRVQRLGPPHWPLYPPGAAYGALYERDREMGLAAARLGARLIAADLAVLGIDVDCLPIADVPVAGADPVVGDRAYGTEPAKVAAIAGAIAQGLAEGGVLPVLKHIPGHGRATADSHAKLPVVTADRAVLEATDFAAFRPLAELPLAMTAHVVFTAIDPIAPATISATIVREVIRDSIGFKGLLMSDDISMGALSGSIGERTRAAIASRLRRGASLQRRDGGDARGRRRSAPACRRSRAAGRSRAGSEEAREVDRSRRRPRRIPDTDDRHVAAGAGVRMIAEDLQFVTELPERGADEPALVIDVEGFEGPLDLLLTLARQQKVDLAKISILALADQYLAFIEEARKLRLELAADYLVMAAWLAYLKSRLLLPEQHEPDGISAEDMATALAQRLRRLEAIRQVAEQLLNRPQLGREVFPRGLPEPIAEIKQPEWSATLYDLLSAYAGQRQKQARAYVRMPKRTVWSLAEAREAVERLIGQATDWCALDEYLIAYMVEPSHAATCSRFELCRHARIGARGRR